ncbi:MAG TPA: MBL fold metallo-hydrolase [Streptosporangiaceae bacterium]|nr:MBL fold metallo-hydrolase [Streptosporangiaceae bacterium]
MRRHPRRQRAIEGLGHALEDIELVIVTHQHIDHLGLVSLMAARSGADVAAIDVAVRVIEDYTLVLPGHGDPFTDHHGLSTRRLDLHRRSAEKIHHLIEQRPNSAYEIAGAVGQRRGHAGLPDAVRGARPPRHADRRGRACEVAREGLSVFEAY